MIPMELTEKMVAILRDITKDWWHWDGAFKTCNACFRFAKSGEIKQHADDCAHVRAVAALKEYDAFMAKEKAAARIRQKLYGDGYEDERFCDHCDKDTPHHCIDSDHERDSSGMQETCKVCGWWKTGISSRQMPP